MILLRRQQVRRSAALERLGPGRGVEVVTYPGLGDVLIGLTACYALAAAGWTPRLSMEQTAVSHPLSWPDLGQIPHLPLLGEAPIGARLDIRPILAAGGWVHRRSLVDAICEAAGVSPDLTPRTPCLLPVESGGGDYVALCDCGHSRATVKALAREQVAAAVSEAGRRGLEVVRVGMERGEVPAGVTDLGGETGIRALCAIVAGARAVVTAETGVLHLAQAYQVPTLALCPEVSAPWGAFADYAPILPLVGPRACDVPAVEVAAGLRRVLDAAEAPWCIVGPDRLSCGVSECGRRVAAAAGVSYVQEPPPGGVAVALWHADMDVSGLGPRRTVLDAHAPGWPDAPWAGVITHAGGGRYPVPLPTLGEPGPARRPLVVGWHGAVVARKGLRELLAAWGRVRSAVPDAELRVIGSVWHGGEDGELAWLRGQSEPGLRVDVRRHWGEVELARELGEVDVHCYPEGEPATGETSGAASEALGYGRPVVVGAGGRYDAIRPWCVDAGGDLAGALVRLLTDAGAHAESVARAAQGASWRTPAMVARHYRAAAVQAAIDEGSGE